jgi:murein DD-endopeptidase MepM/ murein hydrolase activator NlpD
MSKKQLIDIIILIGIAIIIIVFIRMNQKSERTVITENPIEDTEPQTAYGIIIDSMLIFTDFVKKNQYLSDILIKYNVDYQTIDKLAKTSREIFDVRKIRSGNKYSVICTNDSIKKVQYFVYESSAIGYIVCDLRDSVHIHKGEKEIIRKVSTASGIISSSLWNSLVDNDNDPNLANELSEIFAWTIDFFGIQKGDNFKVIYDKLFVEEEYIGVGNVKAAVINHMGKDYYSIYFAKDSIADFYDDEGGSMRRTFLKAPLKFKRISSGFSYSRLHPILKVRKPHLGVDYAAAIGTPVVAVGDGVVTFAKKKGANGNIVKIKHNGTYSTAYLHLSKFGPGIKSGKHVKQGDVIGYVGSTGRSTGPHLDFRFYKNGNPVDPLKVKSPPAKPVDSIYIEDYNKLVSKMKAELINISIK